MMSFRKSNDDERLTPPLKTMVGLSIMSRRRRVSSKVAARLASGEGGMVMRLVRGVVMLSFDVRLR